MTDARSAELKRAYDPTRDTRDTRLAQATRKLGRRAAIRLIAGGVAGTVAAGTAIQTGASQVALEAASQAVRELLRPKPIAAYLGDIVIPLKDVNIRGQTRVTNPFRGDVLPQNVKKYNGKPYNRERFMSVINGIVVEGETPKGEPGGKWLEIKVDDGNPTGEYYAYMSLSEETERAIGKLDQSKFQKIKSSSNDGLTLENGTTLHSQQINVTSFR